LTGESRKIDSSFYFLEVSHMNRIIGLFVLVLLLVLPAVGQQVDTTGKVAVPQQVDSTAKETPAVATPAMPATAPSSERNMFFGGTVGVSFGSYFRLSVQPMVGWNLTQKFSAGFKLGYEYINDKRYTPTVTWHNYGASTFGRFRFIPQAYLHAEFAYVNYGAKTEHYENERVWVPFLYVGGGYIKSLTPKTALFVEVLFDVLQDSNSPYEAWQPMISIGVMAGI
jgi:hypothetical protein